VPTLHCCEGDCRTLLLSWPNWDAVVVTLVNPQTFTDVLQVYTNLFEGLSHHFEHLFPHTCGLYASLNGFNPRRFKVPHRGWASSKWILLSYQNLLLLLPIQSLRERVNWHMSGMLRCRTVTGSMTACGWRASDSCVLQYENSASFELPDSPSPEICVSVVVNNVLQVNMTSMLWCEYISNVGEL